MSPESALLLRIIDEAFEKKAWHGPNLLGSLRGVRESEAAWRPSKSRHNIWELVLHAAYWKYAVRRRLLGEGRGSFAVKGSNWFTCPSPRRGRTWRQDVVLLEEEHRKLRQVIASLTPSQLHGKRAGSSTATMTMLYGIAFHDLYHAGQIQLLKRLQRR
jgi:hypothetical protein